MYSACGRRGRPTEALGRTASQSAGSEASVANRLIAPSSSTSATFADCSESTLPTTTKTARTFALEKETPGGRQPSASESTSIVVASRRLGGLHHRYNWAVEKLAG